MQLNKYIGSDVIINNIYRQTGAANELNQDDLYFWMSEFMLIMNFPIQYTTKVISAIDTPSMTFDCYKVKLPCDFIELEYLVVNGRVPTLNNMSNFYLLNKECFDCGSFTSGFVSVITDNFGNTFVDPVSGETAKANLTNINFDINNNYMTFNVKEGKVCMQYKALLTDCNNVPMIPDNVYYIRALTWYCIEKIDYQLFRQGRITDKVYEKTQSECAWAVGQLSEKIKMPDEEQMNQMKHVLTRLIRPDTFEKAVLTTDFNFVSRRTPLYKSK